jgi:hypothetical protein
MESVMPDFSAVLTVSGVVGVILGLIIGFATGAMVLWIIIGVVACLGATIALFQPWRKNR